MGHEDFNIDSLRLIALPVGDGTYDFVAIFGEEMIAYIGADDAKKLATWLTTDKSQEEIE